MIRHFVSIALAFTLVAPVVLRAHEGHDHKIMGTLVSIDASHLVVKPTDGPEKSVKILATTTYHRGKAKGTATELKAGLRVVVNVGAGKDPVTAKDIQYAAAPTTK